MEDELNKEIYPITRKARMASIGHWRKVPNFSGLCSNVILNTKRFITAVASVAMYRENDKHEVLRKDSVIKNLKNKPHLHDSSRSLLVPGDLGGI